MINEFERMGQALKDEYSSKDNIVNDWVVDRVTEILNEGTQVEVFTVESGIERGKTVYNNTRNRIVKEDYREINDLFHERGNNFANNTDWWQFREFVDELVFDKFIEKFGDGEELEELMEESYTLFETINSIEIEHTCRDLDGFIKENNIIIKGED